MKKLNLGCGFKKISGYVNVDKSKSCEPDEVVDLVSEQWPWENSSVNEVLCEYVVEQLGTTPNDLKHVFQNLYRVCANNAEVRIVSLYPRHDEFFLNPLCTQRISPDFFQLMSVSSNLNFIAQGRHYNCLGLDWGINFETVGFKYLIVPELEGSLTSGEMSENEIRQRMLFENNICHSIEISLKVIKI